ncbi:helix-turn-helix transcriptional regulator [Thiolapillus brandeum]|nr:WYL domain-containing protein [Thiolapillus brandeum]
MDRTERFHNIDQLLRKRRATPLAVMMEELGMSRATVKRDIEYMRDRLGAPIVWDRSMRGYRYDENAPGADSFSLPGLWFNASEVHALLTMDHLLANLQPGLLGPHIDPLRRRVHALLEQGDHSLEEVENRIRISRVARRDIEPQVFEVITTALLQRQRLRLYHYNRASDKVVEREVSPQRLLYYRDNWYLDAWCHLRKELRSFAVDAVRRVEGLHVAAKNLPEAELDAVYRAGYGIFSGRDVRTAILRFSPGKARWVSSETWHGAQNGYYDEEGCYVLEIPYSVDTELIMDILRHGMEVEVIEPPELREKVKAQLRQALNRYE